MRDKDALGKTLAGLRLACLAACVLALVDVGLPTASRRRVTYLLFDVSDSVGRVGAEESRRKAAALIGALPASERVGAIAFAKKPLLVFKPLKPAQALAALEQGQLESGDHGETDVSLAFAYAAELLRKEKGEKAIILFGDGRATVGSPSVSERLLRQGLKVYAYPVGQSSGGVVSRSLEAPDSLRAGERAKLRWRISTDADAEIGYVVKVDGVVDHKAAATLRKGEQELEIEVDAGAGGNRVVEIEARDAAGAVLPLASSGAMLRVDGSRKALVIRGGERPSPILAALRLQGIEALDGNPDSLPESAPGYSGLSAVVLDDVSALSISESRQRALVDFASSGGGLLVFGGYSSLGRGEYYSSVLEDALPVETDTRQRLFFNRAKILFVIDHSGSMSEDSGGVSKQMAAMRGVAASVPELNPQDEVGIMSFDSMPTWVLPFTPAGRVDEIRQALQSVPEGGGTDMSKAIEEVLRGFGEVGPNKRHAVVLTDGLTPDADFRGLSARLKLNGISVSTIGIGEEVNERLLRDIAEWNDGVYHRALLDDIPRIIKKETIRVTRDLIQEGSFQAQPLDPSPILDGIEGDLPRYDAYLITKAKPLADVILATEAAGKKGQFDPLMALWRYGNGKVCVFASDSGGDWLSSWAGRPAYKRLWAQTLRAIERSGRADGMQAVAELVSGRARIAVEARDPDGRASIGLSLSARDESGADAPVRLVETSPGRYEGTFGSGGIGLRTFEIRDSRNGAWTEAWLWNPGGAELASSGPDKAFLSDLTQSNGGMLLSAVSAGLPKPGMSWLFLSARIPLILAALALLLAELYCRSALFGQLAMAKATIAAWLKGQAAIVKDIERGSGGEFAAEPAPWSPDDSGKAMNAYRRLAERYRGMAAKRAETPAPGDGAPGAGGEA